MGKLIQLFKSMIVFSYQCFDRIVINGYISMLSRPEGIVYFFHAVVGKRCITKEVLKSRTDYYNRWVDAYARNHKIPIQWAEKKVRKEDIVLPELKRMERKNLFGVYYIMKGMEQGNTFRSIKPRFRTKNPDYRIIKNSRSRYAYYYFYIRDEVIGSMLIRVASYLPFQTTYYLNGHNIIERELIERGISYRKNDNAFLSISDPSVLKGVSDRLNPEIIRKRIEYWTLIVGPKFSKRERKAMNLSRFYAISQIEYCRNFIFRNNSPIRKIFNRSCELGLFSMTADKVSNIFGWRITKRLNGKLKTVVKRIDQGHHIFHAHFKNSYVKQYEKYRTFLRMEICTNNTYDLRIQKSIEHMEEVRNTSKEILDRFAGFQAESLNSHFDFPLLQRLSLPITAGKTRIAGIKIQNTRMIRLMEVLMHSGACINGFTSKMIHELVVQTFELPGYTINQLRYDLRKMKAHGLIERNKSRYSYVFTDKGIKVSAMFILFHKRLCGPLANSLFERRPDKSIFVNSELERAYHKADNSIEKIIELIAA